MPREEHLVRQVEWKKKLEQYSKVELEKQLTIRGAKIFTDVYAQIEGKEFIIEIGDIGDDRKNALLQLYAESRPNVVFIHEAYGENKIQKVLEQINAYLHSPEYQLELKKRKERQSIQNFWTIVKWIVVLLGAYAMYYAMEYIIHDVAKIGG